MNSVLLWLIKAAVLVVWLIGSLFNMFSWNDDDDDDDGGFAPPGMRYA